MSTVRDRAELARKLPFFCGKGMRSYAFLQSAAQRQMCVPRSSLRCVASLHHESRICA